MTINLETAVHSGSQRPQVSWIRADNEVVAAQGSLDDGAVDDVARCGLAEELAHAPCLVVLEPFDVAAQKEP
jgi:hypothetical protein